MNVTPDMAAPTIASAATAQWVRLPPVKKPELSARRDARIATTNSSAIYAATVIITVTGLISVSIFFVSNIIRTNIRISEGKSKLACILPSESILGEANV